MPRASKKVASASTPDESTAVQAVVPRDPNENRDVPASSDKDIKDAIEVGLPKLTGKESEAYKELHGVYVRFIKQSPEKWEVEKDNLLAQLEKLA